jgi:hypothetical protein
MVGNGYKWGVGELKDVPLTHKPHIKKKIVEYELHTLPPILCLE